MKGLLEMAGEIVAIRSGRSFGAKPKSQSEADTRKIYWSSLLPICTDLIL